MPQKMAGGRMFWFNSSNVAEIGLKKNEGSKVKVTVMHGLMGKSITMLQTC